MSDKFEPIGIGPAHYIGPELGGDGKGGRRCSTCRHIRNSTFCVHPDILKTKELVSKGVGKIIHPDGCCDYWRNN